MRSLWMSIMILLAAGCNSEQLRFTSLRIVQSVPDLQERQVIDNLSRIAASPGNVPYYTVFNTGTVNVNDTGAGGLSALNVQPRLYTSAVLTGTASRSVTGNWTLNTIANPERLRAMRAAYLLALGLGPIDPIDLSKLNAILEDQRLPGVPTGWLCIGTKHDVPHGAWIRASHDSTYVWVMPEHARQFADFSLLMLNIATWSPPTPPTEVNLTVSKPLPVTNVDKDSSTSASPAFTPPAASPSPFPPLQRRLYEDTPSINRGLFFVPR